MSPIRHLIAVPLALAALLVTAGSTLAVPPERFVEAVDVTFPLGTELCGFPVSQHLEGTFRQTTFVDRNGEPVRILETSSRWRITLTNEENGASISTVGSASAHVTLHDDGSATVAVTGLQGHLKSPDGGHVRADVGRLVLAIPADPSQPVELLQASGQFSGGPFPDACDLLS